MDTTEQVAAESARIVSLVRSAPTAAVPTCPGWTLRDLAEHLGTVWPFVTAQLTSGSADAPVAADTTPAPQGDAELADWLAETADRLVDTLRRVGTGEPAWTWGDDNTTGFFHRRMLHETTIHRFDAEAATGDHTPIDPEVAFDGINELIEVGMRGRAGGGDVDYPAQTLHLHRTDGDGEWMLAAVDGELRVTYEHGKGDAAARGPAADLYTFLWGRGRGGVETFGDESVVDAWIAVHP